MKKIFAIIFMCSFFSACPVMAEETTAPNIEPRTSWITKEQEKFTKSCWKPKNNVNNLLSDYHKPKFFIIHHTESLQGNNPKENIQNIFQYHAVDRGWGDIGYNYIIDKEGAIYEGRKGGNGVRGAHALNSLTGRNYNYESIGIALIGDYNKEKLSEKTEQSLAKLIGFLSYANDIDLNKKVKAFVPINNKRGSLKKGNRKIQTFLGHANVDDTTCPGENVVNSLEKIKQQAISYQNSYRTYAYTTDGKKAYVFKDGYWKKSKSILFKLTVNKRWLDIFKKKET